MRSTKGKHKVQPVAENRPPSNAFQNILNIPEVRTKGIWDQDLLLKIPLAIELQIRLDDGYRIPESGPSQITIGVYLPKSLLKTTRN